MRVACLVDTTRCIGCRSCQVACKQSNGLPGTATRFFAAPGGYQNPGRFSPTTFTYVSYHELEDAAGDPIWVFVKRQCMHCVEMYCGYVCPPGVYRKTPSGVIVCQPDICTGCAACVDACPFQVPAVDYWNLAMPVVRKCSFCLERQQSEIDTVQLDGKPLSPSTQKRHERSFRTPACAKACPSGALQFGDRDGLLAEAKRRIAAEPEKYVQHVYGETEAGGTGWLYLSRVPFEKLGFPTSFEHPGMYQKVDEMGATASPQAALAALESGRRAQATRGRRSFRRPDGTGSSAPSS